MKLDGLDEDVVGIIIVGAEGCSETQDEPWVRDATKAEIEALHAKITVNFRGLRNRDPDISDFYVDGNNRPYWAKAVLRGAPDIAVSKAEQYSRCLRLTD